MKVFEENLVIGDEYKMDNADSGATGIYVGEHLNNIFFYPTNIGNYLSDKDGTVMFLKDTKRVYEEV